LRVPRFGLIKYLTDEVDRALDFVDMARFLALDHDDCGDHTISGRNIEKKDVVSLRSSKDWRRGKELFYLCESSVCLLRPDKILLCLE
jgi:hypothetical protein